MFLSNGKAFVERETLPYTASFYYNDKPMLSPYRVPSKPFEALYHLSFISIREKMVEKTFTYIFIRVKEKHW